ncbi:MAG: hypothetical protein HY561_00505, partial [Gemmatimonadetes bacterium]|nr:hypothetical protein [Gemmatimonadota bacterium]
VTLRDVLGRRAADARTLRAARWLTFAWGGLSTGAAFLFARASGTVIETVNQVGSLFYGPILGLFLLGILLRGPGSAAALGGFAAGLAVNAGVWRLAPGVSWMWWNAIGLVGTLAAGSALSRVTAPAQPKPELLWRRGAGAAAVLPRVPASRWALVASFAVIVLLALLAPKVLGGN